MPSLPLPKFRRFITIAESFLRYDTCSKSQNPPTPLGQMGGLDGIPVEVPLWKKEDLGGFKNHGEEAIFGKRYNRAS